MPSLNGTTPLLIACRNNDIDIVKYLIHEMGANPSESKDKNSSKITPLSVAISKGHFTLARYLIKIGCRVQ
jgi:ankyrin repeat protein